MSVTMMNATMCSRKVSRHGTVVLNFSACSEPNRKTTRKFERMVEYSLILSKIPLRDAIYTHRYHPTLKLWLSIPIYTNFILSKLKISSHNRKKQKEECELFIFPPLVKISETLKRNFSQVFVKVQCPLQKRIC